MKKIALLTAVLGVMFCFAGACPAAAATAAVKLPGNSGPWRVDTQQPYLYEDVVLDCLGLAERYPGIIAADSLCTTFDGRQVPHLLIGDVKASKHVLIMGAIHAREYMTSQLVMKQTIAFLEAMESGTASYKGVSLAELMQDTAIHVLPLANPDGVTISQLGPQALHTEAARRKVNEIAALDGGGSAQYYLRWKANAEGVDLNRQFDGRWAEYKDPAGHPSSDHYKGTSPLCTAEAAAFAELTLRYPFKRTISYHEQGGVIYWYFGQQGSLLDETKAFADAISAVTGYPEDANYQKLDPAGYKDWAIEKLGIPSLTVEVGSGTCPLPASQLPDMILRNKDVWMETLFSLH